MKREKISEAMGNISSRHINEAAEFTMEEEPHKSKTSWVKWASLAACFCIIVMSAILIPNILDRSDVSDVNPGKDFGATNGKLSISTINNA